MDRDLKNDLRVALSMQRDVARLMRDCDAETGRFRGVPDDSRILVLRAAGKLFDCLDRLIDDLTRLI